MASPFPVAAPIPDPRDPDELRRDRSRLLAGAAAAAAISALCWAWPALVPGALRDLALGSDLALPAAILLCTLDLSRARRRRRFPPALSTEGGPGGAPVIPLNPRRAPLAAPPP